MYDIIIIGSGPAGLTAAIYASRAQLTAVVLEKDYLGSGQIAVSEQVDNYPGLPGIDGYELCRRIRASYDTPILFLSARDGEVNKIIGLELGADDYLAKPFGIRELIARTRALLRRSQATNSTSAEVSASGIALDDDAHTATGEHGPIDLTPREFELMSCLMHNAGKVVSREDLLREAWGWEFITETKTVDTHIKRLRDKIEAAGYNPQVVETVRGYGYRFKK